MSVTSVSKSEKIPRFTSSEGCYSSVQLQTELLADDATFLTGLYQVLSLGCGCHREYQVHRDNER